jgi:hypothetical protein
MICEILTAIIAEVLYRFPQLLAETDISCEPRLGSHLSGTCLRSVSSHSTAHGVCVALETTTPSFCEHKSLDTTRRCCLNQELKPAASRRGASHTERPNVPITACKLAIVIGFSMSSSGSSQKHCESNWTCGPHASICE